MDEYTPDKFRIRSLIGVYPTYGSRDKWLQEFDRWLAEHDRVVAANAWDECDRQHLEYEHSVRSAPPSNPYRITEENN